jgi:hypothetical protein
MARRRPTTRTRRPTTPPNQPRRATKHPGRISTVAFALVALAAAAAPGCKSTDANTAAPAQLPARTTSTSAVPATSSTTVAGRWSPDEQAVIDIYQQFQAAAQEAMLTNDGNLPALDRATTSEMRNGMRDNLAERERQGLRSQPAVPSKARAEVYWVSVNGDAAHLAACVLDDGILYRTATGEAVNGDIETVRQVARFERLHGVWKVAAHQVKGDKIPGEEMDQCVAAA